VHIGCSRRNFVINDGTVFCNHKSYHILLLGAEDVAIIVCNLDSPLWLPSMRLCRTGTIKTGYTRLSSAFVTRYFFATYDKYLILRMRQGQRYSARRINRIICNRSWHKRSKRRMKCNKWVCKSSLISYVDPIYPIEKPE
jgi:hypothetical protein